MKAIRFESFTRLLLDRLVWGSKPPVRCSGSWSRWRSWGSIARWAIRRRSARPNRENKSTIDEMPGSWCSCWLKIVFLRSGCLPVNNSASVGTHPNPRAERLASDRLVVTDLLYSRAENRPAIAVSAARATDRRLGSKGRRVGLAETPGRSSGAHAGMPAREHDPAQQ
jgi:hypothetical protein